MLAFELGFQKVSAVDPQVIRRFMFNQLRNNALPKNVSKMIAPAGSPTSGGLRAKLRKEIPAIAKSTQPKQIKDVLESGGIFQRKDTPLLRRTGYIK